MGDSEVIRESTSRGGGDEVAGGGGCGSKN